MPDATRAPWHVNAILNNRIVGDETAEKFDKLFISGANTTIATVYREADARLIAAAPALLEALRECMTDNPGAACYNTGKKTRRLEAINEIVCAAIAKVKGN
jgi:hypothetical protein